MLNPKARAKGRRVMGKNLLTQYKEVANEFYDVQELGMKPADSIDSMLNYFNKLKEVAEKHILVLGKVKEQQISFETFIEQTREIKRVIRDEKITDAN